MKLIPATLAILLLLGAVVAFDSTTPKNIGTAKVFLELNWSVGFQNGLPNTFTFKTFSFPTTKAQVARVEAGGSHPFAQKTDSFGNNLLEFSFSPKRSTENMVARASVDVDYANAAPMTGGEKEYLATTDLTRVSAGIAAKALGIKAGASGETDTVVRMTDWVHNRVRYDGPGYGASIQNANWVFENQVGTCDEYSHLLISMLRSLSIPAKFVAGYVCSVNCTESANWGPHAWVEAYADGKWVPADPTFNEAILLDATHVKFAQGADQNDIKESLSTTPFGYSLSNVRVDRAATIGLDEAGPFPALFELEVSGPNTTLGGGASANITARIKSTASEPIAVPLSLSAPAETNVIGETDSLVYLLPGKEITRQWQVILPNQLQDGYTYSFPAKVSALGEEREITIKAQTGGQSDSPEGLHMLDIDPRLEADGSLAVKIQFLNTGQKEIRNANVVLDTNAGKEEQTLNLEVGSRGSLEFTLHPQGLTTVSGRITADTGTYKISRPILVDLPQPTPTPGLTETFSDQTIFTLINDFIIGVLKFLGMV